jgi:diguanylate cyclase (GGDEF)-like protein
VLLIDLDRFKEVNDTLGHPVGDTLLRAVARRLSASVRESDTLVRLGGDEFAVILPEADHQLAVGAAQRLLSTLARPFPVEDLVLTVDASLGVAVSGETYCVTDFDVLLRQADVAMYAAKDAGGGWAVYEAKFDHNDRSRLTLLADLRRAVTGDELLLHYQPKVDLPTGRLSGVEALIRWQHPTLGLLVPAEFLPLAETTTLIHPITLRVLDMAVAQVAQWQRDGHRVPVAVNLAARSVREDWLVPAVGDALTRHGVAADLLRLEITETTLMVDPESALRSLLTLREMGVRLSIDDFGTGYSSMSYLRRLPVDEIKVDRSFVSEMLRRRDDAVLVKTVVDLGHNLGMSVVAEGVEDAPTLDALADLRCDVAQGYHLGRPTSPEAITALLEVPSQRAPAAAPLGSSSGKP